MSGVNIHLRSAHCLPSTQVHTPATVQAIHNCLRWILRVSPVNIEMDPPQIATEGFSSDSLSERYPEQYTKNVEKSRRANIVFFLQNPKWQLQT